MSTTTISDEIKIKHNIKTELCKDGRMIVNIGPQHPATHGTIRFIVELDGETIVKCIPELGYLHSGFEKLGENLTYGQYLVVTDRMNYLSPLLNNIAYVEAVEKLMGVKNTERCMYIRVILGELTRILDHLLSLGTHAMDLGAFTPLLWMFKARERLLALFEMITGHRFTTSFIRVGGLGGDMPDGFDEEVRKFCKYFLGELGNVDNLLTKSRIWIDRTKGVGKLSKEDAVNHGATGPILRSTGFEWDLRKEEPYDCYDHFDFDVPVGTTGDTYDRYLVRMEEMRQSISIVIQALDNMPSGSVDVDDPKLRLPAKDKVYNKMESLIHHFKLVMDGHGLQPPKGKEVYNAIEGGNGELGFHIVSDGTGKPYKVRTRPPSLMHFSLIPLMIEGCLLTDLVTVIGSVNLIAGEFDR